MVNVQPLRNPFLPADVHVDVTFFVQTCSRLRCSHCLLQSFTDFHKRMVRSIAGLKEIHGSSSKSGRYPNLKLFKLKVCSVTRMMMVSMWPQVRRTECIIRVQSARTFSLHHSLILIEIPLKCTSNNTKTQRTRTFFNDIDQILCTVIA